MLPEVFQFVVSPFIMCSLVPAVINTIVEPSGGLQTVASGTLSLSQTRPSSKEKKAGTKLRGTTPASNANESTKRLPRGSNGGHHMV